MSWDCYWTIMFCSTMQFDSAGIVARDRQEQITKSLLELEQ